MTSVLVFAVARHIDPAYADSFNRAKENGVEFFAVYGVVTHGGITLEESIDIEF